MKAYDQTRYQTREDGESTRLPVGGYICKITGVTDLPEKEYLRIEFDIADGPHKGYFAESYQRFGYWGGSTIRSYKETARSMFNGFVQAVENSNPGYKWDWNEKGLVGKLIGVVIGEREYLNKANEIRIGIQAAQIRSIDIIREGKYKPTELRRLSAGDRAKAGAAASTGYTEVTDEDLPF